MAEGMKVLINKGLGKRIVGGKTILPGGSISLPAAEAVKLMQYHDFVDAASIVPEISELERLQAENKAMKDKLAAMAPANISKGK